MPITTYTKEKVIRKNGVDAILTTGTKIAEITVSGDTQEIFAPDVTPIEVTAAQYEALSSADKMNPQVVYFVKDVPDVSVWIGTQEEYDALPNSLKNYPRYLFCIKGRA